MTKDHFPIISITNGVPRNPEWRMAAPVNFTLEASEQLAIVGDNASGKSMFVDMLTGAHPLLGDALKYHFEDDGRLMASDHIKYIAFRDTYGGDADRAYFLQQRWNQTEIDASTPKVDALLELAFRMSGPDTAERRRQQAHLYQLFQMGHVLDKYIVTLSSGEMRKYQLIRALLSHPRVLVLDNPFIGLDAGTRAQLSGLLETIARAGHTQLVLVLSRPSDIPPFVTHTLRIQHMVVGKKQAWDGHLPEKPSSADFPPVHDLPRNHSVVAAGDEVVRMNDVTIRYGNRVILSNLNWVVRRGERWAVSGQNGAGKSTLLSIVCADNPQAYACDVRLFGHKRGTGQSIWDVKRHIGYVSPEMHRAYQRDITVERLVASGLADTVGLYFRPSEADLEICRRWLAVFGLDDLAGRSFLRISSGQQRLALLARAFVKDPDLLILDEPLHGLDDRHRQHVLRVVEQFCEPAEKTLLYVTHYQEELPRCMTNRLFLQRHV